MSVFDATECRWIECIERLEYCNPFVADRIACERAALGDAFEERFADWNRKPELVQSPNNQRLAERCEALLAKARDRGGLRASPNSRDRARLDVLLVFALFRRFRDRAAELNFDQPGPRAFASLFDDLVGRVRTLLPTGAARDAVLADLPHLFACFHQLHRAFDSIFHFIHGVSSPAVALRAAVWQSIFSHDMRRYRVLLYPRMADYTTLILGPSGTGKELVARAIGRSRYIPFDVRAQTFASSSASFFPISLSAMSPTLIESELFGHVRGSFTGAIRDRHGWLEVCPAHGTVFLDEIGELEPALQVKLLRVLQDRTFSRIGETETRPFAGKIVAATNRDLDAAMHAGRFRPDLYYRLCSDILHVPTLRERLKADPGERRYLVDHLLRRIVGAESPSDSSVGFSPRAEAPGLADSIEDWIDRHIGKDYPWPGNVRELEQCLRNVLIRGEYHPPHPPTVTDDPAEQLASAIREGTLTAEEMLCRYCTLVYRQTGSYEAAAQRLQLDRRTVKAKVASGPVGSRQ